MSRARLRIHPACTGLPRHRNSSSWFSTNGKENKISVVDLKTLKTISKVDTGENPDAIVYDSNRGEVYVFNHTGKSATVIDAKTAKVVATIPLGGSPEFAAVDSGAGRVLLNHRRQERGRGHRHGKA